LIRVRIILSSRRICTKFPILCGVFDTSPIRTTRGLTRSGWWLRRQWCLGRKGSTAAATFASRGATCASVRRLPVPRAALRTKFGTTRGEGLVCRSSAVACTQHALAQSLWRSRRARGACPVCACYDGGADGAQVDASTCGFAAGGALRFSFGRSSALLTISVSWCSHFSN
jgi:hypothetical protein